MALRAFSAKLFAACPLLQRWSHRHEEAFDDFLKYKTTVPVCGGILLNSTWDKCVLVKGYKTGSPWGFPRGKINENEPLHECATREVLEETGYNCSDKIREDVSITILTKDHQLVTLYIVPGVSEDYAFLTRTRKEISKIEWFNLSQLPGFGSSEDDDGRYQNHRGVSQDDKAIKTWGISPFLRQLKQKLYVFQVMFGYVPPNMMPHQLRDYKRAQKQVARAAGGQQTHGSGRGKHAEQRAESETVVDQAAVDSESTGAEGDEEPEQDTDYDYEPVTDSAPGNGRGLPTKPSKATSSAIDALFTRTSAAGAVNGDGYSSPDVIAQTAAAKRAPKASLRRKSSRTRLPPATTAPPQHTTAHASEASNDHERAHLNNLLQSLTVSNNRSHQYQMESSAGDSGLPTPAESPVVPQRAPARNANTASHPQPQGTIELPTVQLPTFDFVSPFDALSPVKKKAKDHSPAKPAVTILKRPAAQNATSSSASSKNGSSDSLLVPRPTTIRSSSSSLSVTPSTAATTSGSEDRSGSENMGDVSSSADDDNSFVTEPPAMMQRSPRAEAPSTLDFGMIGPSAMMRGASNNTVTGAPARILSPDNAIIMTPKARAGSLNIPTSNSTERLTGHAPAYPSSMSRASSLASTGSSSSAQHLALLDMVATEADVIAQSTCPTPQGLQGGALLPPVNDKPGWNSSGLDSLQAPRADVQATEPRYRLPTDRAIYSTSMNGSNYPMPTMAAYPTSTEPYPLSSLSMPTSNSSFAAGFNSGLPSAYAAPQPQYPPQPPVNILQSQHQQRPALPPHLHHPHPLMHPQQNIRIPSASPTPHRRQDTTLSSEPISAIVNSRPDVLYNTPNTTDHTMHPTRAGAPAGHVSTIGARMMEAMHGSTGPLAQAQVPLARLPSAGNVAPLAMQMQGQNSQGGLGHVTSPILNRLQSRPLSSHAIRHPYPIDENLAHDNTPQTAHPYPNFRQPFPPAVQPDTNSFTVQKSSTDRAELLSLLRTPTNQSDAMLGQPSFGGVPVATNVVHPQAPPAPTPKRPPMVFESGFVPANVQYRALAKAAFSGGAQGSSAK